MSMACNAARQILQTERCAAVCPPPRRVPCPRRGGNQQSKLRLHYLPFSLMGVDMGVRRCGGREGGPPYRVD